MKRLWIIAALLACSCRAQDAGAWWGALAADAAALPDVTDGLVAWWKLDEGSGTNAYDAISGQTASLLNGAVWTSQDEKTAVLFPGAYSTILTTYTNPLLTNDFTISAWVWRTNATQGVAVSKRWSDSTDYAGFLLGDFNPGPLPLFYVRTAGAQIWQWADTAINNGQWHHMVGVRLNITSTIFYVDGVLKGASSSYIGRITDTSKLQIGNMGGDSDSTLNYGFGGCVRNVRFYNRVLFGNEVITIYNHDK